MEEEQYIKSTSWLGDKLAVSVLALGDLETLGDRIFFLAVVGRLKTDVPVFINKS